MTNLAEDRQALLDLIKDEAVFHGDFTLSSGKKATYYVDMRKLTLDHRAAPAIGRMNIRGIPRPVAMGSFAHWALPRSCDRNRSSPVPRSASGDLKYPPSRFHLINP